MGNVFCKFLRSHRIIGNPIKIGNKVKVEVT